MLLFLHYLSSYLQPLLIPICFVLAWVFILTLVASLYSALRDTTTRAQEMHSIPCSGCQFFTNDYRLKCTVNPLIANTEEAIGCHDYSSRWLK